MARAFVFCSKIKSLKHRGHKGHKVFWFFLFVLFSIGFLVLFVDLVYFVLKALLGFCFYFNAPLWRRMR